ncbi:MAG: tyrosine-type recombinase/integrase [Deltaproteobacteria bacterium]|nr:tyrosine-type recombinase/integrase [Deltaproteobacteria bacterium]
MSKVLRWAYCVSLLCRVLEVTTSGYYAGGNPRDRAMIMVLLRTGMRIGELLNTKMNDLHLKDRKIDIYEGEKNRQGRVVYRNDDAMDALKVWLKIRPEMSEGQKQSETKRPERLDFGKFAYTDRVL